MIWLTRVHGACTTIIYSMSIIQSINVPILVICKTLKYVISSAIKVETVEVFINTQIALPLSHTTKVLGYLQLSAQIKTNKSTTTRFTHDNMQ